LALTWLGTSDEERVKRLRVDKVLKWSKSGKNFQLKALYKSKAICNWVFLKNEEFLCNTQIYHKYQNHFSSIL